MLFKTVGFVLFIFTYRTNGCCDINDLELFDTIDLDSNGFISRDEFLARNSTEDINNVTNADLENMWASFDFVSDEGIKCQGINQSENSWSKLTLSTLDFQVHSLVGLLGEKDSRNFKSIIGKKDECCAEIDEAEVLWILKPFKIQSRLLDMDTDDTGSISCAELIEEITQFSHFVFQRTLFELEKPLLEEKIKEIVAKQKNSTMTLTE